MGISQIKFSQRKVRKNVKEWLWQRRWSLSDLAEFLTVKGIKTPIQVYSYDSYHNTMSIKTQNGKTIKIRLVEEQEEGYNFILLRIDNTEYQYRIGYGAAVYGTEYTPIAYEIGRVIQVDEYAHIESMYEKEYNIYEFYVNTTRILRLELYNPTGILQNSDAIEKQLGSYFKSHVNVTYSADEILDKILEVAGFDAEDSEEIFIQYTPQKQSEKEIYTIIRKAYGIVTEFEVIKGKQKFSAENGVYHYSDSNGKISFNLNLKTYSTEMTWEKEMPGFLKSSIFSKISELEKKLESTEE